MVWNPFLDAIQKAVNRSGLSNADIARDSGVDRSVIGRILSGERIPTQNTLKRITDVLPRLKDGEAAQIEQYRKTAWRLRDQSSRSTDEIPVTQTDKKVAEAEM